MAKYCIYYDFYNGHDFVHDYLNNNGMGFSYDDAEYIAYQLTINDIIAKNIKIIKMGE